MRLIRVKRREEMRAPLTDGFVIVDNMRTATAIVLDAAPVVTLMLGIAPFPVTAWPGRHHTLDSLTHRSRENRRAKEMAVGVILERVTLDMAQTATVAIVGNPRRIVVNGGTDIVVIAASVDP